MDEVRIGAADGTELAVSVGGDGPPLLLIPGLGATRVVFDPLLPHLTDRYRVAVYDQRGIGSSQQTMGRTRWSTWTRTTLAGTGASSRAT